MAERFTPDEEMIDRYIQQRLSGQEQERFEYWLMDNPRAVESLDYMAALRVGVKMGKAPAVVHRPETVRELPVWLAWLTQPGYALAAATALLLAIAVPSVMLVQLSSQAPFNRPSTSVLTVSLAVTRGDDALSRVILNGSEELVILKVLTGYMSVGPYAIVLSRDARKVFELSEVSPDASDTLTIVAPAQMLSPGQYELLARSVATGEAFSYRFSVESISD